MMELRLCVPIHICPELINPAEAWRRTRNFISFIILSVSPPRREVVLLCFPDQRPFYQRFVATTIRVNLKQLAIPV